MEIAPQHRHENAVALTKAGTALVRKGDALMRHSRAEAAAGAVDTEDADDTLRRHPLAIE